MAFSKKGLRVLAFGYQEVEKTHVLSLDTEYGFVFLGLISMIDPPREESKELLQMQNVQASAPL